MISVPSNIRATENKKKKKSFITVIKHKIGNMVIKCPTNILTNECIPSNTTAAKHRKDKCGTQDAMSLY